MSTKEELWGWVETPLRELHSRHVENPEALWTDERAYFLQQLGIADPAEYPVVDALLRELDESAEQDRAELLGDLGRLTELGDRLADRYASPEASAEGADGTQAFDEASWYAFLAEHGPNWDGTGEHWEQFEPWLLAEADAQGFGPQTEALFAQVRGQGAGAVIELFRQYGVTISPPAQPTVEELAAAAARDLLAENPEFAEIPESERAALIAEAIAELGTPSEVSA